MAGIIGGNSNGTGSDVLGAGDASGTFDSTVQGGDASSTFDDPSTGGSTTPSTGGGSVTPPSGGTSVTPGGSTSQPAPTGVVGEIIPLDLTPSDHGDLRKLWFESLDGTVRIDTNIDAETILTGGATGLGLTPHEVVTEIVPGIPGSVLREENELEREVFLPLVIGDDTDQGAFLASMKALRQLVKPRIATTDPTTRGRFNLVVSSPAGGERLLAVTYKSGLEGLWGGADSTALHAKFGLVLVAVDPYFHARAPRRIFYSTSAGKVFLGDGSNANPWNRQLSSGLVVGDDMVVTIDGEVEVWPTVTVIGQVSTADIQWTGTDIEVPNGVPSGSSLVLVMDPRDRKARMDGSPAWSRITLTGLIAPLVPGENLVSVVVATAGDGAGLVLEWLEGWETAWA